MLLPDRELPIAAKDYFNTIGHAIRRKTRCAKSGPSYITKDPTEFHYQMQTFQRYLERGWCMRGTPGNQLSSGKNLNNNQSWARRIPLLGCSRPLPIAAARLKGTFHFIKTFAKIKELFLAARTAQARITIRTNYGRGNGPNCCLEQSSFE